MAAYYNEFKPEAAHMLRQLIKDGLIAPGEVDERSITEVLSDDIKGFTQCHFFAGIGGWSVALRHALWSDDRPVWTGSCPCQPFSSAGKQKGKDDARHLWPVWFRLIRKCRPVRIYGEQVAAAIAHGWWDDVANDLEAEGYAVGAAVLPACSVGKPHKRDRLWFVGDAEHHGWNGGQVTGSDAAAIRNDAQGQDSTSQLAGAGQSSDVADTKNIQCDERGCGDDSGARRENEGQVGADSGFLDVANADGARLQGHGRHEQQHGAQGWQDSDGHAWETNLRWVACPDGKQRPVEPSICLLAHGVQHRASLLHGYGNAIVPAVAAAFIEATNMLDTRKKLV